jgi:hypothetical protein
MRGIIISDNMQVLILGGLSVNLLEEFEKLFMCMFLVTLAGYVTRGDLKCCKKGIDKLVTQPRSIRPQIAFHAVAQFQDANARDRKNL